MVLWHWLRVISALFVYALEASASRFLYTESMPGDRLSHQVASYRIVNVYARFSVLLSACDRPAISCTPRIIHYQAFDFIGIYWCFGDATLRASTLWYIHFLPHTRSISFAARHVELSIYDRRWWLDITRCDIIRSIYKTEYATSLSFSRACAASFASTRLHATGAHSNAF